MAIIRRGGGDSIALCGVLAMIGALSIARRDNRRNRQKPYVAASALGSNYNIISRLVYSVMKYISPPCRGNGGKNHCPTRYDPAVLAKCWQCYLCS